MSAAGPRVLLVGEDASTPAAREALAGEGCELLCASRAREALEVLDRAAVDVVVASCRTPGLDGIDLTRAVRRHPDIAELHVIVVAPIEASELAVRALEAGADDYLFTPFDPSQLLARARAGARAAALRASEARLASLIANVPAAIYRCAYDPDWTMELVSDVIERITGYPPSDFIGSSTRTFASVIHPEDREALERTIDEANLAGRPFEIEYRVLHRDGSVRQVAEQGQVMHGRDGRVWLDGAIFDVTERRRAEEELRRAAALRALGEERTRIARELHDVVAHGLSVIALQTSGARAVLRKDAARAEGALDVIGASTRDCLDEMRRLLDALRQSEASATGPLLGGLERLAGQVRTAGLPVELVVEGESRPLRPDLDLAAYRIVQEALTNILKHAGPARAEVSVRYGEQALELEVTDDGAGAHEPSQASGHGLAGMRERVAACGGVLSAGPRRGGGYRVRALLPLGERASALR